MGTGTEGEGVEEEYKDHLKRGKLLLMWRVVVASLLRETVAGKIFLYLTTFLGLVTPTLTENDFRQCRVESVSFSTDDASVFLVENSSIHSGSLLNGFQ